MSKYVKNLIAEHLRDRLQNVHDALLVNMVGLDANTNTRLRAELRGKNIHVMVVKNSLAARATEGTPLAPLFDGLERHGGHLLGQRRHRQPGQGNHQAGQGRQVRPLRGPRRRDGRRAAHRGRGRAGQQVAQPQRAVEHPAGPDPQPGRDAGQPIELRRRRLASQIEQQGEGEATRRAKEASKVARRSRVGS